MNESLNSLVGLKSKMHWTLGIGSLRHPHSNKLPNLVKYNRTSDEHYLIRVLIQSGCVSFLYLYLVIH